MTNARFVRYELRTTDLDAARAFYLDVLGPDFWASGLSLIALPEPARARGAPPHWLGHIAVDDVEATVRRIAAAGGQPLGPSRPDPDGASHAVVRDPFGAVLAVRAGSATPNAGAVSWHVHHGSSEAQTLAFYAGLFGWSGGETVELGPELGRLRFFGWEPGGPSAGTMTSAASPPRIHPQWLFFFPVADLDAALARVRARRGLALEPVRTPAGDIVVACDDPQGAAFGLYQFEDGVRSPAGQPS